MTAESGEPGGGQWLVEPPGPQQISFQIAAGDQIEITPEVRQAFENLLEAFGGSEVEGYLNDCHAYKRGCTTNTFTCTPRGKCFAEVQQPCFIDYHCAIGSSPV